MSQALDLFGGREQVQKALCAKIQDRLRSFSVERRASLEQLYRLPEGTVARLERGDYAAVDAYLIENLGDVCQLDVLTALGSPAPWTEEARQEWAERAKRERFVALSGTLGQRVEGPTHQNGAEQRHLDLFVRLKAFTELDGYSSRPAV